MIVIEALLKINKYYICVLYFHLNKTMLILLRRFSCFFNNHIIKKLKMNIF